MKNIWRLEMAKQKTDLQVFQEWVQELTGLVFGKSQQETERAKGFTKEHTEQWLDSVKKPKRKRARKKDGTFRGDDKSTPNVNEAWENE
jgi:hypothetical protein